MKWYAVEIKIKGIGIRLIAIDTHYWFLIQNFKTLALHESPSIQIDQAYRILGNICPFFQHRMGHL